MAATVKAKLKRLFDFQRFVQEPGLQSIIDETISGSNVLKLSDDDLGLVAAGTGADSNSQENSENTMPFHCTRCGHDFNVKLGVKSFTCPKCSKTYYING